MRIDDVNRPPQTQAAERAQQTGSHDKHQHSANRLDDHADISELALANLAQGLDSADPKRLEVLRLQVESGTYQVSASELAANIVDAHVKS
ncbi:MAG: flagellar biosynthesis anti-sigma factor FlgM [Bryobacteraceae bacterium]